MKHFNRPDPKPALIGEIRQALGDAARQLREDPKKPAVLNKRVYPPVGRGHWVGRSLHMWPIEQARHPLWVGIDGQLYYYHADRYSYLPAKFEQRGEQGLRHLLKLIREM